MIFFMNGDVVAIFITNILFSVEHGEPTNLIDQSILKDQKKKLPLPAMD